MDPERVHSYLKAACAGLGFDIGEVWWTSQDGDAAPLQIEEENHGTITTAGKHHLKFVQLYTSKSYEHRRSMLVKPEKEEHDKSKKHVLSPRLVDAIRNTAQVLWANTGKSEGLTGRSDVRLQTAVGLPVAVDQKGNMCVVVMFSPNNLRQTDDAMEFLQFISRSATSSSIPCLLPVFTNMQSPVLIQSSASDPAEPSLGDGVTAHFSSLEGNDQHSKDLTSAPKDRFGIPMLPSTCSELGNGENSSPNIDAFDEATFGVWNTIMNSTTDSLGQNNTSSGGDIVVIPKELIPKYQKDRLEEFTSAFLGMSVFDVADIWVPHQGILVHVSSVTATEQNESLNEFKRVSESCTINPWSGAVGRAYSSGSPVWSSNPNIFVDSARHDIFQRVKIQTALSVPITTDGSLTPTCVLSCYALVRTDAVLFVLRFIQKALGLLWEGLDQVKRPAVNQNIWSEVGPADLGEIAADLEMQQEFLRKKRPHSAIIPPSQEEYKRSNSFETSSLGGGSFALELDDLDVGYGESVPLTATQHLEGAYSPIPTTLLDYPKQNTEPGSVADFQTQMTNLAQSAVQETKFVDISLQIQQAVQKAIAEKPDAWAATTADGSKRAHIMVIQASPSSNIQFSPSNQTYSTITHVTPNSMQQQQYPQFSATQAQSTTQLSTEPNQYAAPTAPAPAQQFVASSPGNVPGQYTNHSNQYSQVPSAQFVVDQPAPAPVQQVTQYVVTQATPSPSRYENVSAPAPQQNSAQPQILAQDAMPLMPLQAPNQLENQFSIINMRIPDPSPVPAQQHHQHSQPQIQVIHHQQQPPTQQYQQQSTQYRRPQSVYQQHEGHQQPQRSFVPQHVSQMGQAPAHVPQQQTLQQPVQQQPRQMYQISQQQQQQQNLQQANVQHFTHHQPQAQQASSIAVSGQPYCLPTAASQTDNVLNGKPCRIQGCNEPVVARRPYCQRHSGNRICEHPGCTKCAQGSTRFCIAHGGGRRCTYPGCDKGARDKYFCAAHGGGKRCTALGCNKSAVGGSNLCTSHGGGRRCGAEGCKKSAQSSTKFCVKHGGGKKCAQPNCEKVARGRTLYCAAHGGGIRCKLNGCNRVAIGKMQLCRSHGGGSRARPAAIPPNAAPLQAPVALPTASPGASGGSGSI